MIDVIVQLPEERWTLLLHLSVSCYHTDRILSELEELGADTEFLERAEELMECGALNYGMAFSSEEGRKTVLVIANTSTAAEFQDSLQHEIRHFVDQYAAINGVTDTEDVAYLTGDINRAIFPHVRDFLCDHCHSSVTR